MKPFTCIICEETYLGENVPDRCPFCGAHKMHILPSSMHVNHGSADLSEQSRKDCQEALHLEIKNQSFYSCAAEKAENQFTRAIFKRLSKQEAEHAKLLCSIMGIEEPEPPRGQCSTSDAEKFKEAKGREKRATNFYLQVASRAPEARVKEVFRVLGDIESEHLKLSNIYGA